MPVDEIRGDRIYTGTVSFGGTVSMGAQITNAMVSSAAAIDASKLIHRHCIRYWQADGANVASATAIIYTARASATIVAVKVTPNTAPTGGDKAFTVDVKKGNASTAFATVLSAVVTMNSSDADRTPNNGTLSTTTMSADDSLQVVIATSGSTGSQGQGVVVEIWVDEQAS